MSHKKATLYLAVLFCVLVVQAGATVAVGQPWTGTLPIPVVNYFGPDPQTYANYTWTSTNATNQGGSVFGYVGGYGFGNNGYWNGRLGPMAGLNESFDVYGVTDTMTLTFTSPVDEIWWILQLRSLWQHVYYAGRLGRAKQPDRVV